MFEGFTPFDIKTQSNPDVTIHGIKSGDASSSSLPPLLLLHGFPQTHHIWHRVVPRLTDRYTVILIDLRGYGASSKPGCRSEGPGFGGTGDAEDDVAHYAKSAMARDCVAVVDGLGYGSSPFFVCAHDRGARVAHKLCVDHPSRVRAALFLDICPTLAMYESPDPGFPRAYFHWYFLIQKAPLPERMIAGTSGRGFLEMFMGGRPNAAKGRGEAEAEAPKTEEEKRHAEAVVRYPGLGIFDPAVFEAYVASASDPATIHAMCQDYRASATVDLDESRADIAAGRKIKCPLRVLWGGHGVIEKCFDAVGEWKAVADQGVDVQGNAVDSGHYIPEEAPETLATSILEFLK